MIELFPSQLRGLAERDTVDQVIRADRHALDEKVGDLMTFWCYVL